jgi:DNA repair protein RadA/Sms
MAKTQFFFVCSSCGSKQLKWLGRCPDCGEWDSLSEQQQSDLGADLHRPHVPLEDRGPVKLSDLDGDDQAQADRFACGFSELDRVLGGGLVSGATVLLGGSPGIGKSTLLLHLAGVLGNAGFEVMYVTSEESAGQIRMRAERLGICHKNIWIDAQTNLEIILNHIRDKKPTVVMIDSVQMVYKPSLPAAPGSVSQLRQCGTELVWLAKSTGIAVILVGHVTKQGMIAGPKILEHIVDVVLYFEGDRHQTYRLIRAVKNRYGSTNELGIFEMSDTGLQEISDPLGLFLHPEFPQRPGRVILAASEGSRILLVEVQALTATSVPGMVRRRGTGVDAKRLLMILAVLERQCGMKLASRDVFVNIVGGVKVTEPAADLAIALAVAGTHTGKKLPADMAVFGELGLLGEIRPVSLAAQRTAEVARHRFKAVITSGADSLEAAANDKIGIHKCYHLQEAIMRLE